MLRAFETPRTFNFFFNGFKSYKYYLHFERIFEGIATPITGGPQFCVRWVALPGLPRYQIEALWGVKKALQRRIGDAHPYLSYTVELFCGLKVFASFLKDIWELLLFFIGKFRENEIDVSDFLSELVVSCSEA